MLPQLFLVALALVQSPPPPPPADGNATGTVTNASQILGKIPLTLLRLLAPETPVYSQSKASVTLVFSRPVIELGSDFGDTGTVDVNGVHPLLWRCDGAASPTITPPVTGRSWWVSTSILRFDPTEAWGNDLHCEVLANPLLRSWDGARLGTRTGGKRSSSFFNTSALTLGSTSVRSARATAATDGAWRPTLGLETSYECPSDCRLSLSFSHRVDREVLLKHLCLMTNDTWPGGKCGRVSHFSSAIHP